MRRSHRFLPDADTVRHHRWLRWMGPALHHPRLWHLSRRGLAMGMALGVFFGLLIPIAQIPLSAAAAVALRANVPAAVGSTLVSNPITFGPLYYVAWRLGNSLIGESSAKAPTVPAVVRERPNESWWSMAKRRAIGVGKPLLLGLAIMATGIGLFTYFVVSWLWALRVRWIRRRRLSLRRAAS
jgi:hypothetical protein